MLFLNWLGSSAALALLVSMAAAKALPSFMARLGHILQVLSKLCFGMVLWHFEIFRIFVMHEVLPMNESEKEIARADGSFILRYMGYWLALVLIALLSWVFVQAPAYHVLTGLAHKCYTLCRAGLRLEGEKKK